MSEYRPEKSEMSTVEFCSRALKDEVAPRNIGSVQTRIRSAARDLGWSYSRTKSVWYADERVSIKPKELFRVEAISGLTYAREEMRKHDSAIERATALLGSEGPHIISEIVAAVVARLGLSHRTGNQG